MNKNTIPSHFEDKVQTVTRMPAPDTEFVDALWSRLEAQTTKVGRQQRMQAAFRTTWRWSLSLAALVLLIGLLVFSINLLPKNSRAPGAVQGTPTGSQRLSIAEAEMLIRTWYQKDRPDLNPQATIPLQELTTDEIWNRLGVQIFQVSGDIYQYDTFLVRDRQIRQMGTAFGGTGVNSMVVSDLNQDGKPELLFTYSFGSGIHRSQLALYAPDLTGQNMLTYSPALMNGGLRLVKTDDQHVTVEGAVFGQEFIPIGQVRYQTWEDQRSGAWSIHLQQDLPANILDNLKSLTDLRETPTIYATSTTPLPATIPNRLVEGACNLPISQAFGGQYTGRANQDNLTQLVGGGSAESGEFTFEIWLACGETFKRQALTVSHFSEIEGLGLLAGWQYHGPDQEGDTSDYQGFEPFVHAQSSSEGMLSSGSLNMMVSGIHFPERIIPDFSQADVSLRYVLKVRTPDGKLSGAALSFVMQRQPEGFLPIDIRVEPLTETDLQSAESPANAAPSFPTIDAEAQYPELKEARQLLDRYQGPLISTPGWIQIHFQYQYPQGGGPYGDLTEWTADEWLQIDEKGSILTLVHIDRDANGKIIQQAVSQDGETHNLTYGTGGLFTPYRLDLGSGLYNELLRRLQGGRPFQRAETSLDGKAAWVYAFKDTFSEPTEFQSVLASALTSQYALDQESGKLLYQELVGTTPDGQDQLVWRMTYETVERVPQPPEEVIQLLNQEPGPYQPAAPEGTPTPAGFDPSQSKLTLKSLPGDDFNRPSFWYGDIYAGDYLLGRVNFGGTPGGWCDRSADGSKLAFSFLVLSNTSEGHEYLRWLDLHNLAQVYDPAPGLELVSKVAWSPQGNLLAFNACQAGQTACGLYLLDADTNQVRRLPSVGGGYVPPVWKPDASQVALLGPDAKDGLVLYVIDVASDETVYTGPFDRDQWKATGDAPTNAWGVEIPQGYTGGGCFSNP